MKVVTRKARLTKKLTLQALAEKTVLCKSAIHNIEFRKTLPQGV